MITVTFVTHDGASKSVDAIEGESLMQTALDHGIAEILADCGGCLSCATCHVHIAADWKERVGSPEADEEGMLEMAIDPDENSRLSCQIKLTQALDGLVVLLPKSQL